MRGNGSVMFWIVLLSVLAANFLGVSGTSWAETSAAADTIAERSGSLSDKLGLDLKSLVSGPNLVFLGAAGVASAFAWEETDEHQGVDQGVPPDA